MLGAAVDGVQCDASDLDEKLVSGIGWYWAKRTHALEIDEEGDGEYVQPSSSSLFQDAARPTSHANQD